MLGLNNMFKFLKHLRVYLYCQQTGFMIGTNKTCTGKGFSIRVISKHKKHTNVVSINRF